MLTDDQLKLWVTGAADTSDLMRRICDDHGVDVDEVESVDFDNWTVTLRAAETALYDSEGCYFDRETL